MSSSANPTTQNSASAITLADLPIQMDDPIAGTFTQEIDHPLTPAASLGTFQQRFWYSTQFASGPNAPVLFYFCGEAECDPWYATTMADSAATLGAAVVVLEHRYYGPSAPFAELTLANMQYLTIHNALEDGAAFERWAKVNLPLSGKWIAVGGSYAGMLAAFFRETHPELVVGAWASSSPVNMQLSFWGYDAIVAEALGNTCTVLFNQALAAADTAYNDPNQCQQVAQSLFGDPTTCQWDEVDFLSGISNIADGAAQYGYQAGLCAALQQEELTPLQGIIEYENPPLVASGGSSGSTTTPVAAHPVIPMEHIQKPALDDFQGAQWFYQVCTEVGFYQIANPDRNDSVTTDLLNQNYFNSECQQYVGTVPNVAQTNATYYAPIVNGQTSNILFVTGSLDPWSNLSFMDPSAPPTGDQAFNVQTGSHCQDLENLTPSSILGVFQAHKLFHDLAVTWLDEAGQ